MVGRQRVDHVHNETVRQSDPGNIVCPKATQVIYRGALAIYRLCGMVREMK